ncbi:MAG TPA: ABC transporter substrate-binding protein [Candidatus Eisenbacteria bacterium]
MSDRIRVSLLRGVCQIPAYVAFEKNFLGDEGLDATLDVAATAWLVPQKLMAGESQFAVIPWTRVAAAEANDLPLCLLAGSGHEEVAIVLRNGIEPKDVKRVAVPVRGGMKDLTAMGLLESLGWQDAQLVRLPSGDGAILAFVGQGVDAASMVEPYATMLEEMGMGRVIRRTGDVWKGAPGCSLTTTVPFKEAEPETVQRFVNAFARGVQFVSESPEESATIAADYIGVHPKFILAALRKNRPDIDAIRNHEAMLGVLALMQKLKYVDRRPEHFSDLSFLDRVAAAANR